MTFGFDSRIHWARRITSSGFGMPLFMPSVRTRTPMECIFSARSRIPVSETISFSKRVPSIPAAIRHNIFSAPAGPSVVMMCITLIMFVFILRSESSVVAAPQSFFGRNRRPPEHALRVPPLRMNNEGLIDLFVGAHHVRHVEVFLRVARGCRSHGLPRRRIFEESVHRLG